MALLISIFLVSFTKGQDYYSELDAEQKIDQVKVGNLRRRAEDYGLFAEALPARNLFGMGGGYSPYGYNNYNNYNNYNGYDRPQYYNNNNYMRAPSYGRQSQSQVQSQMGMGGMQSQSQSQSQGGGMFGW